MRSSRPGPFPRQGERTASYTRALRRPTAALPASAMAALAELNRVLPFKRTTAIDPAKQAAFGTGPGAPGPSDVDEEEDWAAIEAAAQLEAAEEMLDGEDVDMDVLREIEEQEMAERQDAMSSRALASTSTAAAAKGPVAGGSSRQVDGGRAKMIFEEDEDFGAFGETNLGEPDDCEPSLGIRHTLPHRACERGGDNSSSCALSFAETNFCGTRRFALLRLLFDIRQHLESEHVGATEWIYRCDAGGSHDTRRAQSLVHPAKEAASLLQHCRVKGTQRNMTTLTFNIDSSTDTVGVCRRRKVSRFSVWHPACSIGLTASSCARSNANRLWQRSRGRRMREWRLLLIELASTRRPTDNRIPAERTGLSSLRARTSPTPGPPLPSRLAFGPTATAPSASSTFSETRCVPDRFRRLVQARPRLNPEFAAARPPLCPAVAERMGYVRLQGHVESQCRRRDETRPSQQARSRWRERRIWRRRPQRSKAERRRGCCA